MDLLEEVIPSTNHPCFFCILGSILGLRGVVKMLGAVVVKLNPFFAGKRVENCVFFPRCIALTFWMFIHFCLTIHFASCFPLRTEDE